MKAVTRKPRKRRLRKKLRVDEFQEFGFDVNFEFTQALAVAQSNAFWDALIAQIEANGLLYGGNESAFVCFDGRGSATEEDRRMLNSWLSSRSEVSSVVIGPLVDAWHPRCNEPPFDLTAER